MGKYLVGRCPECNAVNAAAIYMDDLDTAKSCRETRDEFMGSGLSVTEIETGEGVTIEGCVDGCSIGDTYRTRLIERGLDPDFAEATLDAGMGDYDYDDGPSDTADEDLSVWSE